MRPYSTTRCTDHKTETVKKPYTGEGSERALDSNTGRETKEGSTPGRVGGWGGGGCNSAPIVMGRKLRRSVSGARKCYTATRQALHYTVATEPVLGSQRLYNNKEGRTDRETREWRERHLMGRKAVIMCVISKTSTGESTHWKELPGIQTYHVPRGSGCASGTSIAPGVG